MGRYNYTNALERLVQWSYKEGYTDIIVDYYGVSQIDWHKETLNSPKHIKIQGGYSTELKMYLSIEFKVYLFLHELGHHQLRKDWKKFKKTLPYAAHAEHYHIFKKEGKYKRRVTYTVSCVEEEFKAWDEGMKLALKLGIKINEKKWNELKSKCLISYIRYYGAKK